MELVSDRLNDPLILYESKCHKCISLIRKLGLRKLKDVWKEQSWFVMFTAITIGIGLYIAISFGCEPPNMWRIDVGFALLAVAHLFQSVYHGVKTKYIRAALHTFCTAIAIHYPTAMESDRLHVGWHHMSYGLTLVLPGYVILGLFGAANICDEIFNYDELHLFGRHDVQYGFDNIFQEYFAPIVLALIVGTILETMALFIYVKSNNNLN